MRKPRIRKLDFSEIEKMTVGDIMTMFPVGSSFVYYDWDKWYVVQYLIDTTEINGKTAGTQLVVIKSWNKYKKRWSYTVEFLGSFVYTASACTVEAKEMKKDERKEKSC